MQMARSMGVALLATLLAAGCGGGDGDRAVTQESAKKAPDAADTPAATNAATQAAPANPTDKESRLASAVADTKTTAPVDLLYDIPAKPEVGQLFTVEFSVKPRVQADVLDIEVADSPGLTIQGERMSRFQSVEAGQPYTLQVQLVGNAAGLYYVSVMAKIATQVQTESRAFSVPVVIGSPVVVQKPAPQKDASGQPIESLPAKEK